MAAIPAKVAESKLSQMLQEAKLELIHRGKVCDTYRLPEKRRLQVRTDRISIFDFVLPTTVDQKGPILTAMTVFWFTQKLKDIPNHLVAFGSAIDQYIPPSSLHGNTELQKRAIVVDTLDMVPVEAIPRQYLTGSGWRAYHRGEKVCGHQLPEGLHDGSKLDQLFFTPTTKADDDHDMPLDAAEVEQQYPWIKDKTEQAFQAASAHAEQANILLVDTKLEWGKDQKLGDEVFTPDSSRYWDKDQWRKAAAERKAPEAYDKEYVRKWGLTVEHPFGDQPGLDKLAPSNECHVKFVHGLTVPQGVVEETTRRYLIIFSRLVDKSLPSFQQEDMQISDK